MNTKTVMVGIMGMSLLAAWPVRADEGHEGHAKMSEKDCSTHCDLRELQKQVDALRAAEKANETSGEKATTRLAKRAQLEKDIKIDEEKLEKIKAEFEKK